MNYLYIDTFTRPSSSFKSFALIIIICKSTRAKNISDTHVALVHFYLLLDYKRRHAEEISLMTSNLCRDIDF